MKDDSKRETVKEAERESGTRKDIKNMKTVDGRHESMRYSRHEMGTYHEGTDHHDCYRGK